MGDRMAYGRSQSQQPQLQGIGPGIAGRLAKKLAAWRKANGIAEPAPQHAQNDTEVSSSQGPARPRKPQVYVPRYRSGAFALLLGLYKAYSLYGPDYFIPKSDLIQFSEQYTDTSFSQYTAWNAMKTLETKSLAERQGGVKYCLTDDGVEIAKKVVDVLRTRNELPDDDARVFMECERREERSASPQSAEQLRGDVEDDSMFAFSQTSDYSSKGKRAFTQLQRSLDMRSDLVHYPEGSYDIILVVDNREVHSVSDRNLIQKELEDQCVNVEIRPLTVGDYLWIARAKPASRFKHLPDIVLDYVVERKRMDDLCASIRDGRYREQHSRIHHTGFTNVFYIVEGNDPDARTVSFEASLKMLRQTTKALESTLKDVYAIPDRLVGRKEFAALKRNIQARFPNIRLAMSFDAYDIVSNKTGSLSVGELYLRMIMTLRGVGVEKALTIGKEFQTPTELIGMLQRDPNGTKRLQDMVIDGSLRRMGPVLGKRLAQFWSAQTFNTTE
ncbi:ERCC4-domain-containing protein [Linderina pennispora]|uniref:Crossover junction endonuclease MUS81 n=1 Tax=Linderina pennispora TaxID=61395 RepID=A0A1Y1W0H7_9FUNG|nr:ERCC4-domain-containing protein [Linderina pennispora]ORX66766.1 ERCC4-domain-containing protein [Linderina pennispora]